MDKPTPNLKSLVVVNLFADYLTIKEELQELNKEAVTLCEARNSASEVFNNTCKEIEEKRAALERQFKLVSVRKDNFRELLNAQCPEFGPQPHSNIDDCFNQVGTSCSTLHH